MDASSNTALSAGLLIYDLLSNDEGVSKVSNKVFPVVSEEGAKLPYICYRRSSNDGRPVKTGAGADTTTIEVACYASTYAHSVAMAEAVRAAMDGVQYEYDSDGVHLVARAIQMIDSEESWQDDAYMQVLTFTIKI